MFLEVKHALVGATATLHGALIIKVFHINYYSFKLNTVCAEYANKNGGAEAY